MIVLGHSAPRLVEIGELGETVLSACSLVKELLDLAVSTRSATSLVRLTDLVAAEPTDSLAEETDLGVTRRLAPSLVVLGVVGWSADSLVDVTDLEGTGFLEVRFVELRDFEITGSGLVLSLVGIKFARSSGTLRVIACSGGRPGLVFVLEEMEFGKTCSC